jgi:hypothetical protein
MNQRRVALWMIAVCMGAHLSLAQQSPEQSKPKPKRKIPAAFEPPEVNESLPNVLLLGDSISIGYMLDVRKQLSGQANVWRPAANCGPTTRGLESLEKWIGDRKWDLIHFNFGLHDLKFMGPGGQNLADPTAQGSHYQVPIEQYRANLTKIAKRLKATGATVIWCETTPVPKGAKGRIPGDAKQYNKVAAQVMEQVGEIQINHLYDFARTEAEQKKANVHYTPAGSAKLAEQVTKTIQAALNP